MKSEAWDEFGICLLIWDSIFQGGSLSLCPRRQFTLPHTVSGNRGHSCAGMTPIEASPDGTRCAPLKRHS